MDSNQIVYQEDLIKGQTNGQDATTFTDVLQITGLNNNWVLPMKIAR